jgi:hypothetical protein
MRDPRRRTGLLLIAGGLLWALVAATDLDGTVVVPGVGVGFLLAYAASRRYGLLVPGGILTGLGLGLVVAAQGGPEASVVLGLGLGFLSIFVLDTVAGRGDAAWWPLIPGGILAVVGGSQIAGIRDIGVYLVPAALIVAGLLLLVRPPRAGSHPEPETSTDRGGGSATAADDGEPERQHG